MNIYVIDRGFVGYDEYESGVVLAETPEKAREIMAALHAGDWSKATITWIDPNHAGVIHSHFHAG